MANFIVPLIGLAGSLLGGSSKPPKPPAPIPIPPPPPPPQPEATVDPVDTVAEETDRSREVRRRQAAAKSTSGLYDTPTNTSKKTLLGE